MEQKGGNPGGLGTGESGRGGRWRSDPTIGGPGATAGRREPKDPLSTPPCDFRWAAVAWRGTDGCSGSQTWGRSKSHRKEHKKRQKELPTHKSHQELPLLLQLGSYTQPSACPNNSVD